MTSTPSEPQRPHVPYVPGPPEPPPQQPPPPGYAPAYQPPYQQGHAPAPPPKKRRTGRILGLTAVIAIVLCGGGIAAIIAATNSGTKGAKHTIVLEVTGPATADITYGIGGDQSQETGMTVPWRKELTSDDAILITILLAQQHGTGQVHCKITIDGTVMKEQTSSGEAAIVTCSNG